MGEDRGFVAGWLDGLLAAIEKHAGIETKRAILQECAEMCTAPWAQKAREIREAADDKGDIDALLDAFRTALPGPEPGLERNGDVIEWRFVGPTCPCPVEKYVSDPELCQCGVAHVKGMLEPLLGRSLEVELVRSRHRGAEDCFFIVHL